jgi:hypothetical protein
MVCGKKEWGIAINMKESIFKIKNMDMEFLAGQEEMYIKGIINKILDVGLERCIGLMEHAIKVNG